MSFLKRLRKNKSGHRRGKKESSSEPEIEVKPVTEQSQVQKTETTDDRTSDQPQTENWLKSKGKLAVDFYQTDQELVIQAPVAGVKIKDLEVFIEKGMLTIKGNRENPLSHKNKSYLCQECYWGPFIRKVALPEPTNPDQIKAEIIEGTLTIKLPRTKAKTKQNLEIKKK